MVAGTPDAPEDLMPRPPFVFEPARRPARRDAAGPIGLRPLRFWSVRHAGLLAGIYRRFERLLGFLAPLARTIGLERLEKPVAFVERQVKGALFDCRMCGRCILSSTGLSCPMNCPKAIRNGPCGGVRADGGCEVYPEMPCVWVKAWEGAAAMPGGVATLETVQAPLDHRGKGSSSWIKVLAGAHAAARPASPEARG